MKETGYAWNIIGHTVYIDQPLGVGFSRGKTHHDPITSARTAGDHLLNFLNNLYVQWPALKASPLYITGESFAGHYIPAFALKLRKNTSFIEATGCNLEGIAIGDGWTDPYNQINQYDSYLYSVGVVAHKFRDTLTWFQTEAIKNQVMGANKNVLSIIICRQLNFSILLLTMMIQDIHIGVA